MSEKKWAHVAGPNRLREWRERTGRNQQEAANLIGLDLASYNSFERGRQRPGLDYAVKIERVTSGTVKPSHWAEAARNDKRSRA
jgi:DNA-binding XRE family transcriptional regulator